MASPTLLDAPPEVEVLSPPAAAEPKPFYGWRYVPVERPDGSADLIETELTLEDACYPQEGDHIPATNLHHRESNRLRNHVELRSAGLPRPLTMTDVIIDWAIPGQRNTSPDVVLLTGVADPKFRGGLYSVAELGGRVEFVIEWVSPSTRKNDVEDKWVDYHQIGVPFYLVVDQRREGGPRELVAWVWTPRGYRRRPADERGRVALPAVGLSVGLEDNELYCYDTVTGERLADLAEEVKARMAAEVARQAAEQRETEQRAARRAAEQREAEQRAARQAAEQREAALANEFRRREAELLDRLRQLQSTPPPQRPETR